MTIYHTHHIIPRHMGGTNDPSNLISLTIKEHAEAHKKLYEKYGLKEDYIAWKALSGQIGKEKILIEKSKLGAKKAHLTRDNKKFSKSMKDWYSNLSQKELEELNDKKRLGMLNKSEATATSQSEGIRKYQLDSWNNPDIREKRCLSMRKPKSKVECPHCKKIGGSNNMKRWHFDNCKVLKT